MRDTEKKGFVEFVKNVEFVEFVKNVKFVKIMYSIWSNYSITNIFFRLEFVWPNVYLLA